jgi:RND family efflux transporter MFP subunit
LVQGYLEKIFVDRGSWVKAGDPLFKISVPDLEKQLEKEKADLAVCGPSIARDEANLAWRETIFNRLQEISKKTPDLINAEALDDAKGKYEVAKAELDLTKAKELGMRATVAKTQAMIDFATYAAPFDGVITDRWVDPGELIQPGTTKMLHLMQVDPIRVRIYVPAPDVRFVRPDSKAAVSFDEIPGKTFSAQVSRSFWALKTTTKTMSVEIDLPNADKTIRPGMYPRVSMELDAHENALVLPAGALVSEKKRTFVYVVKDGIAKKIPIKVGYDDGIQFEVLEGVSDQDEVIVFGKNLVSDNEKVRTTKR